MGFRLGGPSTDPRGFLRRKKALISESTESPLDRFFPTADIRERHETIIRAPADVVFETARNLDLTTLWQVRAIFRLRARMLRAKAPEKTWTRGFVDEALAMGWGVLAREPGRLFVGGAHCQPWMPDVVFTPLTADTFVEFAEPDRVKIAWSLEARSLDPSRTRFITETRAVGTDEAARQRFRRYWGMFGMGILAIRWLMLPAIRKQAEQRWKSSRVG